MTADPVPPAAGHPPSVPPRVLIGGIAVDGYSRAGLAERMVADWRANLAAGRRLPPKLIFDANGQAISLYARNRDFRSMMDQADIMVADGMSMVFASRLLTRTPLPERIAATDFVHDAAAAAQAAGLSFYLLGATAEANEAAVANLRARYPDLRIAGHRHGYFGRDEEAAIVDEVVAAGTDVLWVAQGRPRQEAFVIAHRERLTGVTWIKPCGGLFDFVAGHARRAPDWMQRIGMEWLFRTMLEPRRLFMRYLLTSPHAIWRMAVASRSLPD